MENHEKKNIFISYRRLDNQNNEVTKFQEAIAEKLNRTLSVYFDRQHMENGAFDDNLRVAVESCNCFVPIVSENYLSFRESSDWCKQELKIAIKNKKLIVPVFICDAGEINSKFGIDSTKGRGRIDFENIDLWEDKDLIEYLTIFNGSSSVVEKDGSQVFSLLQPNGELNENCVLDTLKNVFNSFCNSTDLPFFSDLLEKQKQALKQVSILNTSYSFDMGDYIDLGITGNPTTAEKEKAKEEQTKNKEKSLNDFLPKLNNFSLEKFIQKFEKEKYAVVTGDAGQGKSIFLKEVCIKLCDDAEEYGLSRKKLFPIYAEIKRLHLPKMNDENYSFFEALAKASVNGITKEQIESVFYNGRLCLILDAVDEVSPTAFDLLHDAIVKSGIAENASILISSRPGQKRLKESVSNGVSAELFTKTFRLWRVDNISDEKFDIFVKNETLKNNYDSENSDFINKFSSALKEKEGSDEKYKYMSRNPFMLKSITLTYFGKEMLPKNKIEAFDQAVNNLITREQKGESAPIELIKNVLGYIAYNSYFELDRKAENNSKVGRTAHITDYDKANAISELVPDDVDKNQIKFFVDNLVNENGFSHELFACYYCAFYLYRNIIEDENFVDFFLHDINPNADYWKEVIETLICLFELNANSTKILQKARTFRNLLKTMLETMQTVVETPDYDLLCGAVSQFIDLKNNKTMGESVLVKGMLNRGEMGIKSFDKETYKCLEGVNPYEELFYYVVVYDLFLGLEKIHSENSNDNNLSPIQTHLFNELCVAVDKKDLYIQEKNTDDFNDHFSLASSEERSEGVNLKGHISIKESRVCIEPYEFKGCKKLTSIAMPNVFRIGRDAFWGCVGLKSIKIPPTVDYIGESSFKECTGLERVEIPNSVVYIMDSAFAGCTKLMSIDIPKKIEHIGRHAFRNCPGFTSVFLPHTVEFIDGSSFEGCVNLQSLDVDENNPKYQSQNNCLIERKSKTLVLGCKNSVIPNDLEIVGERAFLGCKGLTNLVIPNNVRKIGNSAFADCTSLKSVELPSNLKSIGLYAFEGCTELTNINLPPNIEKIDLSAFLGCSGLTSFFISKGVKKINGVFDGCRELSRIIVDENNPTYYAKDNCLIEKESKTLVLGCKDSVIPSDVLNIGYSAFRNCSELKSIVIPKNVERIDMGAFEGCSALSEISIPNSVEEIDDYAFDGCTGLTSIFIPESVTYVGWYAFKNCGGLESIFVHENNEEYYSQNNCLIERESKTLIFGCKNSIIPNDILCIDNSAFSGCTGLKSIEIPTSVEEICDYAFQGCTELTSVIIPPRVEELGNSAFEGCTGLTSVEIPIGVKSIGDGTFEGCTSLTSIVIPDGVEYIGQNAFGDCTSLAKISIPKSLRRFDCEIAKWSSPFSNCLVLSDIFFKGRKEEWFSIEGVKKNIIDFEKCTVHCVDGDIPSREN